MEPDSRKPLTVVAIVILLVIVILIKGVAPVVQAVSRNLTARLAPTAGEHNSTSWYTAFRLHRIVVAVFGKPPSRPTDDVETASTGATSTYFNPSISTGSLRRPPPVYGRHEQSRLYKGDVWQNRPYTLTPSAMGGSGASVVSSTSAPPPVYGASSLSLAPPPHVLSSSSLP